jgi:hypothetical protein
VYHREEGGWVGGWGRQRERGNERREARVGWGGGEFVRERQVNAKGLAGIIHLAKKTNA